MKVAITGATGFVGTLLVKKLQEEKQKIVICSRNLSRAKNIFPKEKFPDLEIIEYQPKESGIWQESLQGCDAVINLAGEPIAERWTAEHKKDILESRQIGTQKIVEAIAKINPRPQVLINASAIGYYGTSQNNIFTETSSPGKDFLAEVCQQWETEAKKVQEFGVRLVILRIGIVLDNGGALAKMIPPFQMFAGGPIGTGNQWFSWIHRQDLVNLILYILKRHDLTGTFNATAPNPVSMNQLCQTLGKVMNRPSWLPVPNLALDLLLGEGAMVVLEGQKVLPQATQNLGFQYQYPTLEPALQEIIKNPN